MKRLYRSTKERMIAGVCGGIAERFDWDPSLVRIGAVFIGLITAVLPVFITYVIAWIIIPEKPAEKT
jgi:phage shock protein C